MLTVVVVLSLSFKFVLLPPRFGGEGRTGRPGEDGTGTINREIGDFVKIKEVRHERNKAGFVPGYPAKNG